MKDTNAIYVWDATLSCEACGTEDHTLIIKELNQIAKKWCFQLEEGQGDTLNESDEESYNESYFGDTESQESTLTYGSDLSNNTVYSNSDVESDIDESDNESQENTLGYRHFQLRFSLHKKKTKRQLLNLFTENDFHLQFAWIRPTNNNCGDLLYVLKLDTRIEGPWSDKDEIETPIPYHIRNIKLYDWQQEVVDRATYNRSNRIVNVLYCPDGNSGKSTLATFCKCHRVLNAKIIPSIMDSFLDLNQAVMSQCWQGPQPELLFLDIPRALPKKKLEQVMAFCEQVKLYVFDTRYKYNELYFLKSPELWVFANTKIWENANYLSKDRWKIWCITPDKTLVRYPNMLKGEPINYLFDKHPIRLKWWNLIDTILSEDSEVNSNLSEVDCEAESQFPVTP